MITFYIMIYYNYNYKDSVNTFAPSVGFDTIDPLNKLIHLAFNVFEVYQAEIGGKAVCKSLLRLDIEIVDGNKNYRVYIYTVHILDHNHRVSSRHYTDTLSSEGKVSDRRPTNKNQQSSL